MPKITDIKTQVKQPGRVSVYVDGKYSFSLSRDQAVNLRLKVGSELNPVQVMGLKEDSKFGKLRDRTFKWLAIRLRSEHEIEQYLRRKSDDETQIAKLMATLKEMGYVNDAKFAASWVQNRVVLKPISKFRLKQELTQKRVPKSIIDDAIADSELDELEAVKTLIAKRGHRYPDRQKLMAYLTRQGFSYDVIKMALEEIG